MSFWTKVGLLAAGFAVMFWMDRRRRSVWYKAADIMDMHCRGNSFLSETRITGRHRGREITAWHHLDDKRGGKGFHNAHLAAAATKLKGDCWEGWTLVNSEFSDAVSKLFGGEDVRVGEPRVDVEFRIRGEVPVEVRKLLRKHEVYEVLSGLVRGYRMVRIQDGMLQIFSDQRVTTPGQITRLIGRVVDAAQLLEEAAGVHQRSYGGAGWALEADNEPVMSGGDLEGDRDVEHQSANSEPLW